MLLDMLTAHAHRFRRSCAPTIGGSLWLAALLAFAGCKSKPVALHEKTFPRVRVELPAWKQKSEPAISSQFVRGSVVLSDPAGAGRFIELGWSLSPPVPPGTFRNSLAQFGIEIVAERKTKVASHPATEFYAEHKKHGKRVVATHWYCPQDKRSMWLIDFHSWSRKRIERLHRRVLASLRCHTGKGKAKPFFPEVSFPEGCHVRRTAEAVGCSARDSAYTVSIGSKGLFAAITKVGRPMVTQLMISNFFLKSATVSSGPTPVKVGPGGHPATRFVGEGLSREGRKQALQLLVWRCPKKDLSFVAMHAGLSATALPGGLVALSRSRCH
jgi:hypothetical protein